MYLVKSCSRYYDVGIIAQRQYNGTKAVVNLA
jgi:hypothetical protein